MKRWLLVAAFLGASTEGCKCLDPKSVAWPACNADGGCETGLQCCSGLCRTRCGGEGGGEGGGGGSGGGEGGGGEIDGGCNCPPALHAPGSCLDDGGCGRGPCDPGFYDLEPMPGCETECFSGTCTGGDGGAVVLDSPPLPESGIVWQGFSTGGTWDDDAGIHRAVYGEHTPLVDDGGITQTNATHVNDVGLSAGVE